MDRRGVADVEGEAARAGVGGRPTAFSTYLNISWAAGRVRRGSLPETSAAIVFTALCSFIISAA